MPDYIARAVREPAPRGFHQAKRRKPEDQRRSDDRAREGEPHVAARRLPERKQEHADQEKTVCEEAQGITRAGAHVELVPDRPKRRHPPQGQ